jgi:hypothetical protein
VRGFQLSRVVSSTDVALAPGSVLLQRRVLIWAEVLCPPQRLLQSLGSERSSVQTAINVRPDSADAMTLTKLFC